MAASASCQGVARTPSSRSDCVESTRNGRVNWYSIRITSRMSGTNTPSIVIAAFGYGFTRSPPPNRSLTCDAMTVRGSDDACGGCQARPHSPEWSPAGEGGEALPEPSSELRSGVGLVRTTDDAVEGYEARRGKGPARKEPTRGWQGPDPEPGSVAI